MRMRGKVLAIWHKLAYGAAAAVLGLVTITMPSSVDEIEASDLGAVFQGTGPQTQFGGAIYFDSDRYLYTTVNGLGVDPGLSGTAHEVALTGTAPFSAIAWATAAESVINGAGYSVSRADGVLSVTVASPARAAAAASAQNALVDFNGRGGGGVRGATQEGAGNSTPGNSLGWIQLDPTDIPSVSFRLIGLGIRRGNNVTNGVRVSVGTTGTGDGDPEGGSVAHSRTMGNSGAGEWHYEWLSEDEIVEFAGDARVFLGAHGDGAASSLYGASGLDEGIYMDGSGDTLWLTDGTTGSTTAPPSTIGAVTNSFTFGLALRAIIQITPYQTNGGYQVIGGAVPGVHDQDLFASGTPVDSIFVSWRLQAPNIDEVSLVDTWVRLQAHASGASNQLRFELFDAAGGAATFEGDELVSLIGVTSDTQGTGWSSVQSEAAIALTGGSVYRVTLKGEPAGGEESDTIFDVWLGTDGADNQTDAGWPTYGPGGLDIPDTEREVEADVGETQIAFDPQTETASPIASDGTVVSPNNLGMWSARFGKTAPAVTGAAA